MTVIAAHLFLLQPFPQTTTLPSSKVQVTLPPGSIQVGPERVYRQVYPAVKWEGILDAVNRLPEGVAER